MDKKTESKKTKEKSTLPETPEANKKADKNLSTSWLKQTKNMPGSKFGKKDK